MARVIYAIGDIHGCLDQLHALLAKIEAHAGNAPYEGVFLGDYIDRGHRSREVVGLVKDLCKGGRGHRTWRALRGNHEQMMIDAAAFPGEMHNWMENGGEETLRSYEGHRQDMSDDTDWFASLPTMIETENYAFVHAGCSPHYTLADQPDEIRLWIRRWERYNHDFGKHIVYGHTPKPEPELRAHSTGLDTGAFFWGTLTCGVFDADQKCGPIKILQAD